MGAFLALAAALSAGTLGCSSGHGATPTDGGGGGGGGGSGGAGGNGFIQGQFAWEDSDVFFEATTASASLVTSSGVQTLHVEGSDPSGTTVAFDISAMPTIDAIGYYC